MDLNSAIGIMSPIALLIPIVLILILRLLTNRSFIALFIYYLMVCVQLLMKQNVIQVQPKVYQSIGIIDNLLDAPLMLLFLAFFSVSALMRNRIMTAILIFLG